jgi:hypothetical protein
VAPASPSPPDMEQGLLGPGRNLFTIGDWELGIDTTDNVIYHAVYIP